MSNYDFSDFVQASEWTWYSDGLSQEDVNRLPLGSRFYALYKPHANMRVWTVKAYEVRMMAEVIKLGKYRAYVVLNTVELDYAPFELEQEEMKRVA